MLKTCTVGAFVFDVFTAEEYEHPVSSVFPTTKARWCSLCHRTEADSKEGKGYCISTSAAEGEERNTINPWQHRQGVNDPPPSPAPAALVHLDVAVDAVDEQAGGREADGAAHDRDGHTEQAHVREVVAGL